MVRTGVATVDYAIPAGTRLSIPTVAAHYQGMRSHLFGKGTGLKPHDFCIADLCSKCHQLFDNYLVSDGENRDQRRIDHSEQFLYCIIRTLERRIRQGVMKI